MSEHIAVVGAGLAGLAAARTLQGAGASVTVFDKGRRAGGRANTRVHGKRRYDHGAQYFTVRDPERMTWLHAWMETGLIEEWQGRLAHIENGTLGLADPANRFVAVPGMVDLALHLARDLDVRSSVRVGAISRAGGAWALTDVAGASLGSFHRALVAVPAPQAVPLLASAPALQRRVARVVMEPCWAAMMSFDAPLGLPFDGAFVRGGPFSWLARNSSKPGRPDEEAWVVHATPRWTRDHWDESEPAVCALVIEELRRAFGVDPIPDPAYARAHRWGFALASEPVGDILYDPVLGLGACGDWCLGGRVEGALKSGLEIARRLT